MDYYTGILIANTIMYWSPAVIILGGPVVHDIHLESAERTARIYDYMYETTPVVVPSSLGALGGLYGGMAYLKNH